MTKYITIEHINHLAECKRKQNNKKRKTNTPKKKTRRTKNKKTEKRSKEKQKKKSQLLDNIFSTILPRELDACHPLNFMYFL